MNIPLLAQLLVQLLRIHRICVQFLSTASAMTNPTKAKTIRYQNPELQDHLAATYVLGTLRGQARRRMETLMRQDAALGTKVSQWEQRLSPLDDRVVATKPKVATWWQIQAAINGTPESALTRLRRQLNLYRYLSASAFACALLVAFLAWGPIIQPAPGGISYVAVMKDDRQQPMMVATLEKAQGLLRLNLIRKPILKANQSLQLWSVSKQDGSIESLGLVDVTQRIETKVSEPQWSLIANSEYLILTIEHQGGATTGFPSAFVVAKGLCVKVDSWSLES